MEDVIPNQCCVITVTREGFIKRTAVDAYNTQRRGGKGVIGASQYGDDTVEHLFAAATHDYILFFMGNGRFYVQKVYDIPESSRTAKGRSLVNLLSLKEGEKVAAMLCVRNFNSAQNIVMGTCQGVVKKTALKDYQNFRRDGTIGIRLDDGDRLIAAHLTNGDQELMIVTRLGMAVKFHETDLRVQGRTTRGVRGITLGTGDEVKLLAVVDPTASLLIASENGLGKRSRFADYRLQRRGGKGLIAIRARAPICAALSAPDDGQIMLLTKQGQAVRTQVSDIRVIGRATQGVRLIQLSPGDALIGISLVMGVDSDGMA
jgi:DNA gyrase subunit A